MSPVQADVQDFVNKAVDTYGIAVAHKVVEVQSCDQRVAGHKVTPAGTVYYATKHAVRAISEGFRQEVKDCNLRSTIISPGAIDTELPSHITDPESSEAINGFYESADIPAGAKAPADILQ